MGIGSHWVVDIVDCSGHLETTGSALSSMTVVCVVQGYASWHCSVFDVVHTRSRQAAESLLPFSFAPLPVQYKLMLNTGSTNTGVTGHVQ